MNDSQSQAKEQLLSELLEFFQQKAGQSVKGEFPGSAEDSMEAPVAEESAEEVVEMPEEASEMGEEEAAEGEEAVEEAPESTRGFDIEKMKAMIAAKKRR